MANDTGWGGKRPNQTGRPKNGATIRKTITLDPATLAILQSISANISEAVRLLAKKSEHTCEN